MKDLFRYIAVLSVIFSLNSCGIEEMHKPIPDSQKSCQVEFIARPTNYTKTTVRTKASIDVNALENEIHSAFFLMYDNNGRLLRYENLTDKISSDALSQTIITDKGLENVTVCYIANMPESFIKEHMTDLATLKSAQIDFRSTSSMDFRFAKVSDSGYVGVPTIDIDDKSSTPNVQCLPMMGIWNGKLDDQAGRAIEIPVKRLFAKIGFTINLDLTDGSAAETEVPSLQFNEIEVNNVPTKIHLWPQEKESEMVNAVTGFLTSGYREVPITDPTILNKESISFFFYVPEYIVYPITAGFEEEGWFKERNERYKPELAGHKKATHLTFNGILSKQGQEIEVTYKIYLGKNEFDDFSVKRNNFYDNIVRIHGTAYGDNKDAIGMDHRVNIRYNGFLVGFQRATLLDSHFEVRPLRVKFSQDYIDQYKSIGGDLKVEILNAESDEGTIPEWLRLERPAKNTNQNIYCLTGDKFNHTKRKYFTTDLVTKTLESNTSISYNPFEKESNGGDLKGDVPVWVYVDEYGGDFSDQDVRKARIRVSFTPNDNSEVVSQDFSVQQRAIYPIPTVGWDGQSRTYGIEYFEEYLHNYDSQDNYGAEGGEYFTSENGIKWGFNEVQFSETDRALYFTGDDGIIDIDALANFATSDMNLFYDFYLERDKDSEDDEINTHNYSGYDFNMKIINKEGIANIDRSLSQKTESVVEYCYNKNKRNADGKVISVKGRTSTENSDTTVTEYYRILQRTILGIPIYRYYNVSYNYGYTITRRYEDHDYSNMKWYAPSIDELEDIVVNSIDHEFFSEVFLDNLYWSAQPAYDRNYFQYIIGVNEFTPYGNMNLQDIIDILKLAGINIPTRSRTHGTYMSDNPRAARATKYDPYSTSENKFISSDLNSDNPKEGFYKATTMFGTATVDNYFNYPHTEHGNFVYDLLSTLTYKGGINFSIDWKPGDVVAMTSYKREDGRTDIKLPEGIQDRNSEHRVRCVYNPNPKQSASIYLGRSNSGFTFKNMSRTTSSTPKTSTSYTTISSESEIPAQATNPPR